MHHTSALSTDFSCQNRSVVALITTCQRLLNALATGRDQNWQICQMFFHTHQFHKSKALLRWMLCLTSIPVAFTRCVALLIQVHRLRAQILNNPNKSWHHVQFEYAVFFITALLLPISWHSIRLIFLFPIRLPPIYGASISDEVKSCPWWSAFGWFSAMWSCPWPCIRTLEFDIVRVHLYKCLRQYGLCYIMSYVRLLWDALVPVILSISRTW